MNFRAGTLGGDLATRGTLSRNIIQAEVRRDLFPAHAFILGAEDMIAARVQNVAVVWREHDWERPGKTVSHVLRCNAGGFLGPHVHQLDLTGAIVIALQRAGTTGTGTDGTAVDDVVIDRVHRDEAAFAGAGIAAVAERDGT